MAAILRAWIPQLRELVEVLPLPPRPLLAAMLEGRRPRTLPVALLGELEVTIADRLAPFIADLERCASATAADPEPRAEAGAARQVWRECDPGYPGGPGTSGN